MIGWQLYPIRLQLSVHEVLWTTNVLKATWISYENSSKTKLKPRKNWDHSVSVMSDILKLPIISGLGFVYSFLFDILCIFFLILFTKQNIYSLLPPFLPMQSVGVTYLNVMSVKLPCYYLLLFIFWRKGDCSFSFQSIIISMRTQFYCLEEMYQLCRDFWNQRKSSLQQVTFIKLQMVSIDVALNLHKSFASHSLRFGEIDFYWIWAKWIEIKLTNWHTFMLLWNWIWIWDEIVHLIRFDHWTF